MLSNTDIIWYICILFRITFNLLFFTVVFYKAVNIFITIRIVSLENLLHIYIVNFLFLRVIYANFCSFCYIKDPSWYILYLNSKIRMFLQIILFLLLLISIYYEFFYGISLTIYCKIFVAIIVFVELSLKVYISLFYRLPGYTIESFLKDTPDFYSNDNIQYLPPILLECYSFIPYLFISSYIKVSSYLWVTYYLNIFIQLIGLFIWIIFCLNLMFKFFLGFSLINILYNYIIYFF